MIDREEVRKAVEEYKKMVNVGFEIPERQRIIFTVAEQFLAGKLVEVKRCQFTRYDAEELHPECNNKEYLEYVNYAGEGILKFGYQIVCGVHYQWIRKELAEALVGKIGKEGKGL